MGASGKGDWFDSAGLGVFIHWDHASQQGLEVSWPLVGGVFSLPFAGAVSAATYHASAPAFNPTAWDPAALADYLSATGVRYVVITTKHHNGFAMWDSRVSEHTITHTAYARDLLAEFVTAMRSRGLRIGFYFSLSDWHHVDYPAWTDDMRPYVLGQSPPRPTPEAWERFQDYLMAQLTELLTDYGPIDIMWFDGQWERSPEEWDVDAIAALIHALQPTALINDRLPLHGDYDTPEQFIPATPPERRWETCMTLNESWGFNPLDTHYKNAREVIRTLCEVRSRGGNLLLNVSPRGDGSLPPEQIDRMNALGAWVGVHEEAIRDVRPGLEPWQFYGPSTQGNDRTYLFLTMQPYDEVTVRGLRTQRIRRVFNLATGEDLAFRVRLPILEQLLPDPIGEIAIETPAAALVDPVTVIVIEGSDLAEQRTAAEDAELAKIFTPTGD